MHAIRGDAPLTSGDVDTRTFPGTSLRAGHDQDEVDGHLHVLAQALRAWERGEDGAAIATASQTADVAFTTRRLRAGYASVAVDDFLVEVREVLAGYESGLLVPPARALASTSDASIGDVSTVEPDEVVVAMFATTRFQAGYDQDEVDDLLDRCVEAMRGSASLTADDVRSHRFTPTRFRDGYEMSEVDALLERLARTLETRPSA